MTVVDYKCNVIYGNYNLWSVDQNRPDVASAEFYGTVTKDSFFIRTFREWTEGSAILTIWYTKDSDTAGSGSWTPSGVPAVHYSTDEQVVGTWIDGRTIYQKAFDNLNITVASNAWTDTGCAISDAVKPIGCMAFGDTTDISIISDIRSQDGGKIYIMGMRNATPVMKQLVIQYVKAT